jgi:hypothetical protein
VEPADVIIIEGILARGVSMTSTRPSLNRRIESARLYEYEHLP